MADDYAKLTAEDLQTLSTAKTLSLIGTCIGLAGTIYAMKANPATRASLDRGWASMPQVMRENKNFTLIVGGLLAAVIVSQYVSSSGK
jgi:hypothetical protein